MAQLSETETGNENLHDDGELGRERMLFYREMIARFGHHLAVFWNIGEENDYGASRQREQAHPGESQRRRLMRMMIRGI